MPLPADWPEALIDCRSWEAFCAEHLVGASSLPADQLFERMQELPQRYVPLVLYGEPNDLIQAGAFLCERGYTLSQQWEWNEALRKRLAEHNVLRSGCESKRLWQPSDLVSHFVSQVMPAVPAGNGLDVACGAGRDLVYLALHGWQMTGIDNSAYALKRAERLAHVHAVTPTLVQRDLETVLDPLADWPAAQFDLINVGRYLHRPLFPVLKRLLKPHGILIYQTFLQGCELSSVGRPRNPRFLLAPHELAQVFSPAEYWLDEIHYLPDGRPVSAFIARLGSALNTSG